MANYLQLTRKSTGEVINGSRLIDLRGLAAHIGIEPDHVEWTLNWMNGPGMYLAAGKTFAETRNVFKSSIANEPACGMILQYLEDNFTNTSFSAR